MTAVSRFRSITAIAIVLLLTSSFFLPTPAFAQQCVTSGSTSSPQEPCKSAQRTFITNPQCACCGNCELSDFVGLGVEVSRFIFGIAGSLALVMLVYGGFLWLASGGSSDKVESGKKAIGAALVGLVIVFSAWIIVNTVLAALTGQIGKSGAAQIFGGSWWKIPK